MIWVRNTLYYVVKREGVREDDKLYVTAARSYCSRCVFDTDSPWSELTSPSRRVRAPRTCDRGRGFPARRAERYSRNYSRRGRACRPRAATTTAIIMCAHYTCARRCREIPRVISRDRAIRRTQHRPLDRNIYVYIYTILFRVYLRDARSYIIRVRGKGTLCAGKSLRLLRGEFHEDSV